MNRSRLQIAKADIVSHFDSLPTQVFKLKEIRAIVSTQRAFWRLAQNTTVEQVVDFLLEHTKLKFLEFPFPQRSETCYAWGDVPLLAIVLNLRKDLHLSHYTAMRIHGLTEQQPTTVYLTDERSTQAARRVLTQSDIDAAFSHPTRLSSNWVEFGSRKIYLLNGANTGHLGVIIQPTHDEGGQAVKARVTDLERTLIDVTLRPAYAGGVFEVAKAYALARERVSVNKLVAMLRKLEFAYPYHQAIGYYLERSGYTASQLALVRRLPFEHDLYLAHNMGRTRYEAAWRLFVPEGL